MINSTDYRRLGMLGLEKTEENAKLAARCYDPKQALQAFREIDELRKSTPFRDAAKVERARTAALNLLFALEALNRE